MNKKFRLFLFTCLLLFVCHHSNAQLDTLQQEKKGNAFVRLNRRLILWRIRDPKPFYDTNYVRSYTRVFTVGTSLSSKRLKMEFQNVVSRNVLQYYPATIYSPGLFVNTSLIGFSIAPGFMAIRQSSKKRGISTFTDYQFNLYAKRFFFDISLQQYSGFYLNNTRNYQQYKNLEHYYKRSDLDAYSTNFNIYYVFNNKKFSFRAPYSFTQSQVKSAGSFVIGTYLSNFYFSADSSVIGTELKGLFTNFPSMRSGNSFSTGLSFGYAYTFVSKKHWYVSTSFIPGLGTNKINLTRADSTVFTGGNDVSAKLKFTFGIGYDNKKWFFACMFFSDNYYSASEATPVAINYQVSKLRFFIGRRFNTKKIEDKILRKLRVI